METLPTSPLPSVYAMGRDEQKLAGYLEISVACGAFLLEHDKESLM